jgi:LAS superfamily LD-carboxypeptidase LdcB
MRGEFMHLNENEQTILGLFPTNNMAQEAVKALKKADLVSSDDAIHIDPYSGFRGIISNYNEFGRAINDEYLLNGEAFVVTVATPQKNRGKAVDLIKSNGGRSNI